MRARIPLVMLSILWGIPGCGGGHRKQSLPTDPASESRPPPPVREMQAVRPREPAQFASAQSIAEERYRETAPGGPRYDITLDEIRKHLHRNTAAFIDARLPEKFARGHIRGAFNVPASQRESHMQQIWENVPRD